MPEYAIVLTLIFAALVVVISSLGDATSSLFTEVMTKFSP